MNQMVTIPPVRCFAHVEADKAHALKPLEEAAEVFAAWQEWDRYHSAHAVFDGPKAECAKAMKACIVDECCDVIQATCNLLAALGVDDLTGPMRECRERNARRGRITDGTSDR